MRHTGTNARTRKPRVLLGVLLLALLLTALAAGAAATAAKADGRALAKPGRPTAKSPSGVIDTVKPLFAWSRAPRAARYEVRVYQAGALKLTKTGITKLSWRCGAALAKNVPYTWRVRARNTRGAGAWSSSKAFEIAEAPALAVGDSYGGGVVAYIFKSGDPGYVPGETHGLIAATADQTPADPWKVAWSNIAADLIGATAQGTALGTGRTNTAAIVAQTLGNETVGYVYCTSGAAHVCADLVEGGYDDWYLPSKDELNKLYLNQETIGGFNPSGYYQAYWSSSECAGESGLVLAWYQYFRVGSANPEDNGRQTTDYKTQICSVRAVRSF
jgi:hypothetical protein